MRSRWPLAVLGVALAIGAPHAALRGHAAEVPGAEIDPLAHTISLDVQDAELIHLLRLIADVTEMNVIIDPSVDQKVTLKLRDVSWRHFLDLVLRMYRLGKIEQGNVMLIAPLDHPMFRPREPLRSTEPMATRVVQLNYADAADIAAILESSVLSAEGSVSVDERTNTLILRDLPSRLDEAIRLIGHP